MDFSYHKTNYFYWCVALLFSLLTQAEAQQTQIKHDGDIDKQEQVSQSTNGKIDLQIVNPIFYINQREPVESFSFKGRTIVKYKTSVTLAVWNRGQEKCFFPTKVNACGTMVETSNETWLVELDFTPDVFLVETDERPQITLVMPESALEVAEIRPGEATIVTYEPQISQEDLAQIKQVKFVLKAKHNGRYSFWEGEIKSDSFPLDTTPNFRILK